MLLCAHSKPSLIKLAAPELLTWRRTINKQACFILLPRDFFFFFFFPSFATPLPDHRMMVILSRRAYRDGPLTANVGTALRGRSSSL